VGCSITLSKSPFFLLEADDDAGVSELFGDDEDTLG
jgi:hypothetical protein